LTPGDRERVLDRDFDVFVPRVVTMRMVDDDIFVRWKRKPDIDLESGAMAMLMAWRDNGDAASRDALIVGFQPFDLFRYQFKRNGRGRRAFEGNLWCYLHSVSFLPPSRSAIPIRFLQNGCTNGQKLKET
jgi:hypothetical protein